eukprot:GHVU01134666.1.p1 GENE.GHVU01134666.1~~GHVU01134666.1.p1  ORF type:complete len:541 (+),score=115.41 GHVU01134666.1:197-1819(+)
MPGIHRFLLVVFSVVSLSALRCSGAVETADDTAPASKAVGESEAAVVELTASNFTEFVTKNRRTVVSFYLPGCPHCKEFAPHVDEAAKQLNKEGSNWKFAKYSIKGDPAAKELYRLRSVPAVRMFFGKPDALDEFKGTMNAKGLLAKLRYAEKPQYLIFSTEEDALASVHNHVLGVHNAGNVFILVQGGSKSAQWEFAHSFSKSSSFMFMQVALFDPELLKTFTDDADKKEEKEETDAGVLRVFRQETSTSLHEGRYTGPLKAGAFAHYLMWERHPDVAERSVSDMHATGGRYGVNITVVYRGSTSREAVIDELLPLAREMRDEIKFIVTDYTDPSWMLMSPSQPADPSRPSVYIMELKDTDLIKYRMEEDSVGGAPRRDAIDDFIKSWKSGQVPRHYKSSPPFEKQVDFPVVDLTAHTFSSIAYDPKQTLFVMGYLPDCEECDNMAVAWKEVAEWAQRTYPADGVVVGRVDLGDNDTPPGVAVTRTPAIFIFPRGPKPAQFRPHRFGSKRTFPVMRDFLEAFVEEAREVEAETAAHEEL